MPHQPAPPQPADPGVQHPRSPGAPRRLAAYRRMLLASWALYVLDVLIGLLPLLRPAQDMQHMGFQPDQTDQYLAWSLGAAAVGLLLTLAYIPVLMGIRRRWEWSRIAGIVMGALATLSSLFTFLMGTESVVDLIGKLLVAFFVFVNILWFAAAVDSGVVAWFRKRR